MTASGTVGEAIGVNEAASPLAVLTAEEMRGWDRRAIEVAGISEAVLMESAGRAAARLVHRFYPQGRVVAVVGRGNNGGDAQVLLRCLRTWGRDVLAVPVGGAEFSPELLHGWEIPFAAEAEISSALRGAAVVVDGLLGTGARGAPRDPHAAAIRAVAASGRPVVALDGPSGVDLTDGSVAGEAIQAELTITFGALKRGLLRFPGRSHAGRMLVVEVGFPPLEPREFSAALITSEWVRARLPRVPPQAHKGTMGSVAVLAGRAGMGGAAVMVSMGALRAGAGMVRVVSAGANRVVLQTAVPEAIFVDRGEENITEAVEASDALVIGPGLGKEEESLFLLRRALHHTEKHMLLDADALTLLAQHPDLLPSDAGARLLLTPHPGEMARLMGVGTPEVLADPFGFATRAAERFRCTVLLKGAPALVAEPGMPVLLNTTGHSGIATGGMGDTLAGIAGALLGLGLPPREAAAVALFYAGRAAELAGRGRGLLPRDVAEALPAALAAAEPASFPDLPDVVLDLPAAY